MICTMVRPEFKNTRFKRFFRARNYCHMVIDRSIIKAYPRKVVYPCVALALHRMDVSLGPLGSRLRRARANNSYRAGNET